MKETLMKLALRRRAGPPGGAKVDSRSPSRPCGKFLRNAIAPLILGGLALGFAHTAEAQSFSQSITYTPPVGMGFYDTVEVFMVGDAADAFAAPGLNGFNDAKPSSWTSRLRDRRTIVATGIAPGTTAPSPMSFNLTVEGVAHAVVVDMVVWDGGTKGTLVDAVRFLTDGAGAVETVPISDAKVSWAGVPSVFVKRGNINIPALGAANQYPSQIKAKNVPAKISKVTVELKNLIHSRPSDLQFLLVGPAGQSALLMADAGGSSSANGVNLVFDDAAAKAVPTTGVLTSGTYKPTFVGSRAAFPAPAPAGPYASSLAVFNGTLADGSWSLYVMDDLSGASGNLKTGWTLTIQ